MKLSEVPTFADQLQATRQVLISTTVEAAIQGEIDEFDDDRNIYLDADSGWPEEMKNNYLALLQNEEGIQVLEKWRREVLAGKPRIAPGTLDKFIEKFNHHLKRFDAEKIDAVCLMFDEVPQMHIDLWQLDSDDPELEHEVYLTGKELTKYGDIGPLDLKQYGFYDYSIEEDFPALEFFDGYFAELIGLRDSNILLQIAEVVAAVVPEKTTTILVGKYNGCLSRFR